MSDATTLSVSGGSSASVTISADPGIATVVATPDSSVSVEIGAGSSPSFSIVGSSTQISVSQEAFATSTVKEQFNTISVATAVPTFGNMALRDLTDVIGDPTSGQVLIYNQGENNFQFADQTGGGGGGGAEELTDFSIPVTNTDGAFDTIIGTTYETNTSMTSILNDILNPYQYLTITLDKFSGSINGSSQSINGTKTLEVGSTLILSTIGYTIDKDFEFVKPNSVELLLDNSVRQTGLPRTTQTGVTLDPSYSTTNTTVTSDTFKLRATDLGSGVSSEKVIESNSFSFFWRFSTRLCAGTSAVTSNSEATALYNAGVDSTLIGNPSSFSLTCTAANASDSNHTFFMIPAAFGTIKSVLQNNSTDVTADFVLDGTFTATNSFGVGVSYYIYRTNDTGAFNDDVVLTVTLN
tara:strand:- start:2544 stop:3773 length:1230 start_codon:yes stop_codon:yes gene_type:complete